MGKSFSTALSAQGTMPSICFSSFAGRSSSITGWLWRSQVFGGVERSRIRSWHQIAQPLRPSKWKLGLSCSRPGSFSHMASIRRECGESLWIERMAFLAALREANEEDENAFPVGYCMKLYEELNAVWCEQIRESRRKLCAKLGTENPRLEDLKLVALSPGPDGAPAFQFPCAWAFRTRKGIISRSSSPGNSGR